MSISRTGAHGKPGEAAPLGSDRIPLETSLPRASYTAEYEFIREREAALFADWFCVGREEAVVAPGDYLAANVAGESILVVRNSGGLAGFYNLCRHRGSRLVPVAGSQPAASEARSGCAGSTIRCPYHGWTYGLDGSLRSAPFLPDVRRYRERLSLHPVSIATWGGFIFARLGRTSGNAHAGGPASADDPGETLQDQLNGADRRLASYPLAQLRVGHRLVYQVAANWKVILENYNECYHCGPVHPELCDLVPAFRRGGGGSSTGTPAFRTATARTHSPDRHDRAARRSPDSPRAPERGTSANSCCPT